MAVTKTWVSAIPKKNPPAVDTVDSSFDVSTLSDS